VEDRPAESPFGDWLARSPHISPELVKVVEEATSEVRLVALVARAATTNWRAAAWLLERRYREGWGPQRAGKDELPAIDPDDPLLEFDQLAERREERQKRRPEGY